MVQGTPSASSVRQNDVVNSARMFLVIILSATASSPRQLSIGPTGAPTQLEGHNTATTTGNIIHTRTRTESHRVDIADSHLFLRFHRHLCPWLYGLPCVSRVAPLGRKEAPHFPSTCVVWQAVRGARARALRASAMWCSTCASDAGLPACTQLTRAVACPRRSQPSPQPRHSWVAHWQG